LCKGFFGFHISSLSNTELIIYSSISSRRSEEQARRKPTLLANRRFAWLKSFWCEHYD
jgi:hypothetical protein